MLVVVVVFFLIQSQFRYCIVRFDDYEYSWYQCNNYCLVFQFSYVNGSIWVDGSQLSIKRSSYCQVSVKDDFIFFPKGFLLVNVIELSQKKLASKNIMIGGMLVISCQIMLIKKNSL